MLWLLPLLALFIRPGRLLGLRADAWTGWWLFCGLVALSYTFFLGWKPVPAAIWAQYLPLYAFLPAANLPLVSAMVCRVATDDSRLVTKG
jgi:hypothetical protein